MCDRSIIAMLKYIRFIVSIIEYEKQWERNNIKIFYIYLLSKVF